MRVLSKSLPFCLLGLALAMTGGCGGGEGGSITAAGAGATRQGSLTLRIVFPNPIQRSLRVKPHAVPTSRYVAGDIPDGSFAVKIVLSDPVSGTLLLQPRIVTAPIGINGSLDTPITINFAALPVGDVKVDVTAHGLTDASDDPLGIGNGSGTITPLSDTQIHVSLTLTAKSMRVTPPVQTVSFAASGSITATVFNASGKPLLTPLKFSCDDPDIIFSANSFTSPATITVIQTNSDSNLTSATVTVLEPDSGLSTTVRLNLR